MDGQTYYLIIFILTTLVILGGLGIVILGLVRKKVKLIALGVLIALLPTMVNWVSSMLM